MLIEDRLTDNFTEYANYVNHERAIPHLYDGLKPVARKILYTMYLMKLFGNSQTKKSSNIVGRTMVFHAHGDASIYGALVRMSQDFSNKVPLVYGRGNFGSLDNDPAAMRYTEAKLNEVGESLVSLLSKKIIPMELNFDGTEEEPVYLPAQFPVGLVNGAFGIGVGMSTSIPSHNLQEVIDATIFLLNNSDCSSQDLLQFIKGPDFNCGCRIVNKNDFPSIYGTGKGSFRLRSQFSFSGNELIITNLPYKIPASRIEEQLSELVNPDIINVVNTTAKKEELRIFLRKNVSQEEIIKWLCTNTSCETTMSVDLRFVDPYSGRPVTYTLKDYLATWLHLHADLTRKDLDLQLIKAITKLEILQGLQKAIVKIDEIITAIRKSNDKDEAKQAIIQMGFSEIQAEAILDIKLSRLTKLDGIEIEKQIAEKEDEIKKLQHLLSNTEAFNNLIAENLKRFKKLDGLRVCSIENSVYPKVMKIKSEKFYVTFNTNHVKVTEEAPKGKYIVGDKSNPVYILHDNMVIPIRNAKDPIITNVHAILSGDGDVFHFSKDGYVKRTEVEELKTTRKAIATKQDVFAAIQSPDGFVLITTKTGKEIQFSTKDVPITKKGAKGVIAVKLGNEQIQKIEILSAPKKGIKTKRGQQI